MTRTADGRTDLSDRAGVRDLYTAGQETDLRPTDSSKRQNGVFRMSGTRRTRPPADAECCYHFFSFLYRSRKPEPVPECYWAARLISNSSRMAGSVTNSDRTS